MSGGILMPQQLGHMIGIKNEDGLWSSSSNQVNTHTHIQAWLKLKPHGYLLNHS